MAANLMKYCYSLLLMLLCYVPIASWSAGLQDPTRPPAGINNDNLLYGQVSTVKVKGLQSVIISPDHCAAIIDGKTVRLGATHGSEMLVEVLLIMKN